MPEPQTTELPNPFQFTDGRTVRTPDDWSERRRELADLIINIQYGGLPPTPSGITAQPLFTHRASRFADASYTQYRLIHDDHPAFHFRLDVLVPPSGGPFPVVLTGDACFQTVSDEITLDILQRNFILAQFSRVAIVPDLYNDDRTTGLYLVYPDHTFGALAAWAWGYHRCIDALLTLDTVDPNRIAAVGHSRGGKTALLAGATDRRIALTAPNASGAGGAGCYRYLGPNSETLADNINALAYWYGPKLRDYLNKVDDLPFDQHSLKALVAPRALLTTEALDDLWANPAGTFQTHRAAREVYRFLGADRRIGIAYRPGDHAHTRADWRTFLDFMNHQLCDQPTELDFNPNPYPDLPPAFTWQAPRD
ncbi:MAG: hypothetical protein CMJ49_12365 [Planctomycetaceae bacterium]|nr:hypothetical protein [Planctomycetaceae bacterium]